MKKLIAKDLKIKFIETLNGLEGFSYEEGNPFLIRIGIKPYFIFLKNLSSAYFKNSPDVMRVQLPYSEHFSKILKVDIPLIVLGYDVENDTVVSWNPKKIKERLNHKSNVSLYSRHSLQQQVNNEAFALGYLSNGEKIVLFKRENLVFFFGTMSQLFKDSFTQSSLPIHGTTPKVAITERQRFVRWLQDHLPEHTVKAYAYEIDRITRELKEIQVLTQKSLYEVKKVSKLGKLYHQWMSQPERQKRDKETNHQNSNAFKKLIAFREQERHLERNINSKGNILDTQKKLTSLQDMGDPAFLETIKPLLEKNQVLQAVEQTSKHFEHKFQQMTFKDWYGLVTDFYKKIKT